MLSIHVLRDRSRTSQKIGVSGIGGSDLVRPSGQRRGSRLGHAGLECSGTNRSGPLFEGYLPDWRRKFRSHRGGESYNWPGFDGLFEELTLVVVAAFSTVWISAGEVLVRCVGSPLYVAVIEFVPAGRVAQVKVVEPPESVPCPNLVEPFSNVTVPVGVPTLEVTFAVNVTDWP